MTDYFSLTIMLMLVFAMFLGLWRLLRGPRLPDRAVALDMTASVLTGFIGAHAIAYDEPIVLDAAIVIALLTFLGSVAFARYIERRALRPQEKEVRD